MIRLSLILLMVVVLFSPVHGGDFRAFNPIPTPNAKMPPGTTPVTKPIPVDAREVEKAVEKIIGAWNTPNLDTKLGSDFYNKSRLLDTMATNVPKDAKIRLLAVQGIQTLNQHIAPDPLNGSSLLVSMVSATARTQIEFNDPVRGFQRGEGTNEYILRVKTRIERGKK
jgi:hypothetical protein